MSGSDERFDPYHKWLGIAPAQQPPHHYRLLGINLFEQDSDVISAAADRQMAHVRTFQAGKHAADSQRLLNELAAARICLLDPAKKEVYDAELRARLLRQQEERQGQQKQTPWTGPEPSFGYYVQGAWRYLAVQCRRFWISFTQLSGAYWRLGIDVYQQGRYRDRLAHLYRKLESLSRQVADTEPSPAEPTAPTDDSQPIAPVRRTYWQRVWAGFRVVLIDRRRTALLRALGKAAYALDPAECGPAHLAEPIRESLARMEGLRGEAAQLAKTPPGQALSPRDVAWILLGVVALILLLLVLIFGRR